MAQHPDIDHHKRKRQHEDDSAGAHSERIPQPPPPQSGNHTPINYLSRVSAGRLKLIQGDAETFSDVLTLINDYEGVLGRHESFASNLGAKLMGPRLLKAMEGVFEGPITTNPAQGVFTPDPVTWLDIVEFYRVKPGDFTLTVAPNGSRTCQFGLKGVQVEITEDDWRMIVSGALDRSRLVPPQPVEEDETSELATLEILEQRLKVLIKRADEVAGKARQLNYHLSGRKAVINSRRPPRQNPNPATGFQAVNQPGPASGVTSGYDLHADLLQQFLAQSNARLPSIGSVPPTPGTMATALSTPRTSIQQQVLTSVSNRPSPGYNPEPGHRDEEEEHRNLVTTKVEKLSRGDAIYPPCDRCKRLKHPCIKHLTACQGCTKKHARCVWKTLTDEEVAWLKKESGEADDDGDEHRQGGSRNNSAGDSQQDPAEPRRDSDRSDEGPGYGPGSSRPASRIAIGRSADDIWRKGPSVSSRHESMDIDVDPRDTRSPRPTSEHRYPQPQPQPQTQEARSRDPVLLSRMATAASAVADNTAVPGVRGGGGIGGRPSGP